MKIVKTTPRERDVLALLEKGYSRKEIAKHLGISDQTVKDYVATLIRKFRAKSASHAVLKYLDQEGKFGDSTGGRGHDFFIQYARVGIALHKNLRDGEFHSDLRLLALRERGAKMEGSFACDGEIVSVTSFGEPVTPSREIRGRVFFRKDFSHDIKPGDEVMRNIVVSMRDVFLDEENYWTLEQFMPCARLDFFISVPDGVSLQFERDREFGSNFEENLRDEQAGFEGREYLWRIENPEIGVFHTIRWRAA